MDPFDRLILRVLRDGRSMDFHQILMEVDFSHNTLKLHLNYLLERGLITREKTPTSGPGRPKFTYSLPRGPGRRVSDTHAVSLEVISIPFRRLKRLCRFQRGGRCRETKDLCKAENCPEIRKEE